MNQAVLFERGSHVRWMIKRDLPEVLTIETEGARIPWRGPEIEGLMRQKDVVGMVAEHRGEIAGHMIYRFSRDEILLERLVVAPGRTGLGVGRDLVRKLRGKLAPGRRPRAYCMVRERDLDFLGFARATGWKAVGVFRDWYDGPAEDAYELELTPGGE